MSNPQSSQLPRGGMPILSGPPPITESENCRQCSKPFNPFLRRSHACGHCGYEYCSTCLSDGQALMPRRTGRSGTAGANGSSSSGGGAGGFFSELREGIRELVGDEPAAPGYDVEKVCLPCLGMLQVTAASVPVLRSLPLKRLKEYLAAYNIPLIGPKEKDDFVQAIVKARKPTTGCLSPEAESYYRRKSVPKGGQPSTSTPPTPRPRPPTAQHARPPPSQARPPQPQYRPPPPHTHPPPRPQPTPPRQAAPTPPRPKAPPPPVPTILSLVSLPKSYLSSLSIGTLKAVLYDNHVRVDFSQVLEKEELINRVHELIIDERKRLERQRVEEERLANPTPAHIPTTNGATTPLDGESTLPEGGAADKPVPTGPMPEIERGLCVVCQDEEATLAVVDCGHLAMCAPCSDLIMATSQECPLCRTRIVTAQRLIRIYRV